MRKRVSYRNLIIAIVFGLIVNYGLLATHLFPSPLCFLSALGVYFAIVVSCAKDVEN